MITYAAGVDAVKDAHDAAVVLVAATGKAQLLLPEFPRREEGE